MAKKIKFALDMGNGYKVRTLDDLQEHFDIEKLLFYFFDGRLEEWLTDRFFDDKVTSLKSLDYSDEQLLDKICHILGLNYQLYMSNDDSEKIKNYIDKLRILKQKNILREVYDKINQIALNDDDISHILDNGSTDVYLIKDNFEGYQKIKFGDKYYLICAIKDN